MRIELLDYLLTGDPRHAPADTLANWHATLGPLQAGWPDPFEAAVAGGFQADRIAWAFASGYQFALRALVPGLGGAADPVVAALCATEAAGNRPRDIRTTLRPVDGGWQIDGEKRWATLGPDSTALLVVAVVPGDATAATGVPAPIAAGSAGRPRLRVARVPVGRPGVTIEPVADLSFVPEMPHARVRLDRVRLAESELLEGDGYSRYLKPFRTVEDIHVQAALLGYLVREARHRGWPRPFVEATLASLAGLQAAAALDAGAPHTHLLLAGATTSVRQRVAEAGAHWQAGDANDAACQRWQRDVKILGVAEAVRTQRAASAWQALSAARGAG